MRGTGARRQPHSSSGEGDTAGQSTVVEQLGTKTCGG